MVLSYYIVTPFYNIVWSLLKLFRRKKKYILYCDDAFDIELYKNIGKYLADVEIVAKNNAVKRALLSLGYQKVSPLPYFPDGVIMFRNMAWKFPHKKIKKIGFKHGAYNFKRHSKAHYYDMFDIFFLSSESEIENVRRLGVKTNLYPAYPKIDSIFDGSITPEVLERLSAKIGLNPQKKTLLFSATWDGSGMSAIDRWYDKIDTLADNFNLLVTVHDWTSQKYIEALRHNPNIYFITDFDRIPYIMLADICISDTSSLIAEFCILDKPVITFKINETTRTLPEVIDLIEKISLRINNFEEIGIAVQTLLKNPTMHHLGRLRAKQIMVGIPDGLSGKRAAEKIIALIPELAK